MNVQTYLERIGVDRSLEVNLENLEKLQMQHRMNVPFENLDVMDEVPIILKTDHLYEKVVDLKRGGFCFELNGLFNWMLKGLGFEAYFVGGSIAKDDGGWHTMNTHLANMVVIDGERYLSDVGIGDASDVPLSMSGKVVERWNGQFRVLDGKDGYYYVQKNKGEGWENQYRFEDIYRSLAFFQSYCDDLQKDPNSNFKQGYRITISMPEGRVTLSEGHITKTDVKEKKKIPYKREDFGDLLFRYFGVVGW